jgi:hypothetical protein
MKIEKKIRFNRLTSDFVEVMTERVIAGDAGETYKVADSLHAESFMNSPWGRERLQNSDYPENVKMSLLALWGDEPTVADPDVDELRKGREKPCETSENETV